MDIESLYVYMRSVECKDRIPHARLRYEHGKHLTCRHLHQYVQCRPDETPLLNYSISAVVSEYTALSECHLLLWMSKFQHDEILRKAGK